MAKNEMCLQGSCLQFDRSAGKGEKSRAIMRKVCENCGFYAPVDAKRREIPMTKIEGGKRRKFLGRAEEKEETK